MKCFYHNSADAVGICKSCNKGVCTECAVDMTNGLACRNVCENEVAAVNQIIDRSKNSYRNADSGYSRNALIFLLLGLIFLIFGIIDYNPTSNISLLTITVGACFIFGGVLFFSMARKYKDK